MSLAPGNANAKDTYMALPKDMSNEGLSSYVQGWINESNRYRRSVIDKLAMQYDAYHCQNTGEVAPQANNQGLPILYSMIQTAVARQAGALFGQTPIVGFEGYAPGEEAIAKRNEVLVTAQLRDCNSFAKAVDFLTAAHLTGTGVARVGWKRVVRDRAFRIPDGMGGVQTIKRPVTEFDGPNWENVDLLDWYPEANKKTVDAMARIGFRYYDDFDSMEEQDRAYMEAFGEPYYIPGSLARIKGRNLPTIEDIRIRRLGLHPSVFGDPQSAIQFGKPVELVDVIGLFPSEMAIDGDRNLILTIANGHTVVARRPLPYFNGKKPCILYTPSPDPYTCYGVGKADLVEPLQAAAARLLNSRLDANDRTLQPHWIGDARKLGTVRKIIAKPGGITAINGDTAGALTPVEVNLNGFMASFQEMAELREFAQMATGLSEAGVQGLDGGGSDRQTAREFLGKQEAANTRLGLEAFLASRFVEELGDWFRDLNQQYLKLPAELNIIGDLSQTDPDTGLPIPPQQLTINAEDLVHNWKAKAMGPLMLTSQATQRQDSMQLLQILGTILPLAQAVDWHYTGKKVVSQFPGWDASKLFVQSGQIPAINMAGQDPTEQAPVPGAGGGPVEGGIMAPGGGAAGQSLTGGAGQSPDSILGGGP